MARRILSACRISGGGIGAAQLLQSSEQLHPSRERDAGLSVDRAEGADQAPAPDLGDVDEDLHALIVRNHGGEDPREDP
jgi:hypothetical protein